MARYLQEFRLGTGYAWAGARVGCAPLYESHACAVINVWLHQPTASALWSCPTKFSPLLLPYAPQGTVYTHSRVSVNLGLGALTWEHSRPLDLQVAKVHMVPKSNCAFVYMDNAESAGTALKVCPHGA